MQNILAVLLGLGGFIFTLLTIPLARLISFKLGVLAPTRGPRGIRKHVPLLGGLPIVISIVLSMLVYIALVEGGFVEVTRPSRPQVLSLLIGVCWIWYLGFLDDKYALSWRKKILGQTVGIIILWLGGHSIERAFVPLIGPVEFGIWGYIILGIVVLFITNAVNLLDGLDGLAGGVCFFAAMVVGIIGLARGDTYQAMIGMTTAGSILGFLRYNFPPAKIFMGDGGSLTLGYLLGALSTSSVAVSAGQRTTTLVLLVAPLLPFGFAAMDTIISILRRWARGQKIFWPDTEHLHHKLMEKFGHTKLVLAIIYGLSGLFSIGALLIALGGQATYINTIIIVIGVIIFGISVYLMRMYVTDSLPKIFRERPHFKFLQTCQTFMNKRLPRAQNVEETLGLLSIGVRDLGFDRVEIIFGDTRESLLFINKWPVHPEAKREKKSVQYIKLNISVSWMVPLHEGKAYAKTLNSTWMHILDNTVQRAIDLHYLESKKQSDLL